MFIAHNRLGSFTLLSAVLLTMGNPTPGHAEGYCPPRPYSNDMTPDYEQCERFCKNKRSYWRASDKTCVDKGFNGVLLQTASNAGECPTCTLTIEHPPGATHFQMVANNGWTASMVYNSAGQRGAQGQGYWPESWPEPYKGKAFYILMGRSDDHWGGNGRGEYSADMTIQTQGTGDIEGKFVWKTQSNKSFTELGFDDWK